MSGFLVTFAGDRAGDVDLNHCSQSVIAFKGANFTITNVDGNLRLETMTDTEEVEINSRDYATATSGSQRAVRVRPNMTSAGQGITGLDVSPRFAHGIGGSHLVGIMSNPDLKGGTGTLTGPIRCYEGKFDGGCTGATRRTVAGPAFILEAMSGNEAVITNGCFVLGVNAAYGAGTGWTGFIRASASGAGGVFVGNMTQDPLNTPGTHPEAGYVKLQVGATVYQMPFFAIA